MAQFPVNEQVALALEHHQAGRLQQAEALYRGVLQAQPLHCNALNLLGALAYQMGRADEAVGFIKRAIAVEPKYVEAYSNLGRVLEAQGELDEAVAFYRRALEINPEFAQGHFNLGNALNAQGHLDEAAACYRRAVEINPGYVDAYNNLGYVLHGLKRDAEAAAAYRETLRLKPGDVVAARGLSSLQPALPAVDAERQRAVLDEGAELLRASQPAAAEEAYRRAIAAAPENAEAHFGLGVALKARGRLEDAVVSYQRAIELRPDLAEAHNNLGNVLGDLERFDEALVAYQHAAVLNPELEDIHANLGGTLSDLGRFEEAAAAYRRALALNPQQAGTHANLGVALHVVGRHDEAATAFREALRPEPGGASSQHQQAETHADLSYALHALGRHDEAVAACREALRLEPHNERFQHHLNALEQVHTDRAPVDYVRKLFDSYATRFDRHLTQELRYDIPRAIVAAIRGQTVLPRVDVLDLGCGTGLVGAEIKSVARSLVGVDLSPKMLAKAEQRGIYDRLVTADLPDYLRAAEPSSMDVAVAADVFIYLGDLSEIFRQVRSILRPAGLFAFSVEAGDESGREFTLTTSGRYAHALAYIRRLAQESVFAEAACVSTVIRNEKGVPVHGHVFVLRRT